MLFLDCVRCCHRPCDHLPWLQFPNTTEAGFRRVTFRPTSDLRLEFMKPYHLRFHLHSVVLLLSAVAVLRLASTAFGQGATVTPSIANNATGVAVNLPM